MPTLVQLDGVLVRMFAGDHHPPHFHIWTPNAGEALVRLEDLAVVRGKVRRREYDLAVGWARENMGFLWSEWDRLNG